MKVHLVDGTYELFRQHFGRAAREPDAGPYAATSGVLGSTLQLLADGATHVAVASDHIIESFRNDLWPGYKSSVGMPPELLAQIPMVEEALVAMGVTTWAMVTHEADDAIGAAAVIAAADDRVEQVVIVSPDKDLGQCVRGQRVIQYDRRKREYMDEDAVVAKFGVAPTSVPDWLGLVGDSADGFPGIAGWGAKTRRPCWPATDTSRTFPTVPGSGTCPGCAARRSCRWRCARTSRRPCCSADSPRWRPTSMSAPSTTGSGSGRPTNSTTGPSPSVNPAWPSGPPHSPSGAARGDRPWAVR